MIRLSRLVALLLATGALTSPALAAGTLDGRWLTEDTRGIVEIAPCGAAECGKIVWIKDPIDPETGKPRKDHNNPDAGLAHRPIMGLATITAITPDGQSLWDAVSYDPRNGETHDITIRLNSAGTKIELKGCELGGMICRSEIWTRAPAQNPATE